MKTTVLKALRQKEPVSGEELGKAIGISRTAVWKYINELRREGYRIDSSPSRGYSLVGTPDSLLPEEIKFGLETRILGQEISYFREVTSTQATAKALAAQGAIEGTLVVAEVQSGGRGRIGRIWTSPPGGIYLSVILRPDVKPTEAPRLPLLAGVAVAQAIGQITSLNPKLKWPNDIVVNGRKAGGILTEMSAEIDRLNWVIIGIGLNVNTQKAHFSGEVQGIATSLFEEGGECVPRVKLLQHILIEIESLYEEFLASGFEFIRQRWKAMSDTIGAQVVVRYAKDQVTGQAVDLDTDGALILRKEDGSLERVIAGDVSLRKV
ncbi:MAG: biotin--[acetyl-CoA-carboxylase] ligase [Chloroflexota bacterium]|nr:biotin--[acetyl-CoA-carboxylase] ligase [Chloroflexota bacterium]